MRARLLPLLSVTIGLLVISGAVASNVRGAPPPTLSIVSPANNAVLGNGSPVTVVFVVTNFNLTELGTTPSSPDSGHVEVFIDGALSDQVSVDSFRLSLPSGSHTIRLQLVMDNGTALTPDVSQSVSVTVTQGPAGGNPGLSIEFPRDGDTLGTDLYLSYQVMNFVLVPPGGPYAPNEGHIHVMIDGTLYQELTDYQPVHMGLGDGPHTVRLDLVDNLHRPLTPDVVASVHFNVHALVGRAVPLDLTTYFAVANIGLAFAVIALMYRKLEA
jgi:archaellum component FlaF (FlaF/FlaG flagellin family)